MFCGTDRNIIDNLPTDKVIQNITELGAQEFDRRSVSNSLVIITCINFATKKPSYIRLLSTVYTFINSSNHPALFNLFAYLQISKVRQIMLRLITLSLII